jgi:tetratricopeptide (TPR) repeat protein
MTLKIRHLALLLLLFPGACSPSADELINKGKSLMDEGEFGEAVSYFDRAIEQAPEQAEAYNLRAVARFEQENYQQAVSDFSEAIRLDSSNYMPYYNRGNAYQEQEKLQQALQDYSRAISIKANEKDVYLNRGVVYFKTGNYQQALDDFNFALRLEEEADPVALLNRAKTRLALSQWEEAVADLEKLLSLRPQDASAYYSLGIAYLQQNRQDEACESFRRAEVYGYEGASEALERYCE